MHTTIPLQPTLGLISMNMNKALKQQGFSLVEIMVGMVIGLLAMLVIVNIFSVYEQQKRTTTGSSDAQTNGAIALFNVQRDVQSAGYGLPVFNSVYSPFNCPINTAIDHDNNVGTPTIGLSPIVITDGNGANGSDTISIRSGDSMRGGIAMTMQAGTAANVAVVNTNIGCSAGDVALVVNQPIYNNPKILNCSMTRIAAVSAVGVSPVTITLGAATNVALGNDVACLGVWNEVQYSVNNKNQLTRSGAVTAGVPSVAPVAMVPDIVNMQAQYGISAVPISNQVVQWVDATGPWAAPDITAVACDAATANRNCIKAIRIAVVARNGVLENTNVTTACSSLSGVNPTGLCAWAGIQAVAPVIASPAPTIDLSADVNWQRYRYRVYESVIPVRNILWSRGVL